MWYKSRSKIGRAFRREARLKGGHALLKDRHPAWLFLLIFSLLLLAPPAARSEFPEEGLTARAALLMDAKTGEILFQRDPDAELPPASTTKVVTALVVLESGRPLTDLLTVSKSATLVPSSKLYLKTGQKMSVRDLLYALLLTSANDAGMVLAEGIGGSVERFSEMMTKKAHDIGALNTHFVNPHGLTAPEHYSTARDLALIFNYALKNPTFREIVQTKASAVSSVPVGRNPKPRQIMVRSHNRMLWSFDGALGGKTGYTLAAQKCFVGAAARNGATVIIAMLGSHDLWGDSTKLLGYGLENYEMLKLAAPQNATSAAAVAKGQNGERPTSVYFSLDEQRRMQSSTGYMLQIASFRERERAEYLQKTIAANGIAALLEPAAVAGGETTYRVKAGPYAKLAEAQEIAREIETKSGFRAIILPTGGAQPNQNPS
ncbi:MAG TPA: D-alanyl-D-alanine carboxypeptidase [Candidatus Binatia bacterium]